QLALLVAMEGDAEVLQVEQLLRRLPAHDLDGVLVRQVVGALDRVESVRLPAVVLLQGRVDPALRRVRMRADRVDLAQDPHRDSLFGSGKGRPLPGEPCPDHQDVMVRHAVRDPICGGYVSAATWAVGRPGSAAAGPARWRRS